MELSLEGSIELNMYEPNTCVIKQEHRMYRNNQILETKLTV